MGEKQFIDEFLDVLYLHGDGENGKYILTIDEATQAAKSLFITIEQENKEIEERDD